MNNFICGCPVGSNPRQDEIGPYCTIHGQRVKGWRSPQIQRPGLPAQTDYDEYNRVYRITHGIPEPDLEIVGVATVPDIRDNRDPVKVGERVLKKANGKPKIKAIPRQRRAIRDIPQA